MARILQLEPDVFVASQLSKGDFAEVAAKGFRSVVDNRPDGESPMQLPSRIAEDEARANGLTFRYQPVANSNLTEQASVQGFARAMEEMPRPVLFYCNSGTRCTILWAQASVRRLGVARTLEIAAHAGYDLEFAREELEEISAAPSA